MPGSLEVARGLAMAGRCIRLDRDNLLNMISFMTIYVNIAQARTRLSELVKAAVRGEDIVICRAGKPQVRLVAVAGQNENGLAA